MDANGAAGARRVSGNAPDLAGAAALAARVVDRCEGCGAERARGSETTCRCVKPRWRPYCTRCVKWLDAPSCAHCLEVARTNGTALTRDLDAMLVRTGGVAGATQSVARLEARVAALLGEFSIDAVAAPLPEWAVQLVAPSSDDLSRAREARAAISDLRLEQAAVRLAIENLGYAGRPTEEKLARTLGEARAAAAALATFDGLAVGHEQVGAARAAAAALVAAHALAETLIGAIKGRNLDRLAEAAGRRDRAVAACARVLRRA